MQSWALFHEFYFDFLSPTMRVINCVHLMILYKKIQQAILFYFHYIILLIIFHYYFHH